VLTLRPAGTGLWLRGLRARGLRLSRLPLTTVSAYAYVNPVVAVLAGIVVLGGQFTWREALGTALVVASVAILHRSRAGSRPVTRARAAPGLRRAWPAEDCVHFDDRGVDGRLAGAGRLGNRDLGEGDAAARHRER
jgi:hypothetical protein